MLVKVAGYAAEKVAAIAHVGDGLERILQDGAVARAIGIESTRHRIASRDSDFRRRNWLHIAGRITAATEDQGEKDVSHGPSVRLGMTTTQAGASVQ